MMMDFSEIFYEAIKRRIDGALFPFQAEIKASGGDFEVKWVGGNLSIRCEGISPALRDDIIATLKAKVSMIDWDKTGIEEIGYEEED